MCRVPNSMSNCDTQHRRRWKMMSVEYVNGDVFTFEDNGMNWFHGIYVQIVNMNNNVSFHSHLKLFSYFSFELYKTFSLHIESRDTDAFAQMVWAFELRSCSRAHLFFITFVAQHSCHFILREKFSAQRHRFTHSQPAYIKWVSEEEMRHVD